jgi:uncharacterized protein (TIGR02145 family)
MCYNLGVTGSQSSLSYQSGANNGTLYQWGRQTDGHEVRTSATQAGPVAAPVANKFITVAGSDWRSPSSNTLWLDASKTANDPCPAGFRVPTIAEWGGLFKNSTSAGDPGTATQNTWTWTGFGFTVGPNLYLPAAGARNSITGNLVSVGVDGTYWSTSGSGGSAYTLSFYSSYVIPGAGNNRASGASVRCISE